MKSRWSLPCAVLKFLRTPWVCCDPPRHLHAFNARSISQLFTRCGFAVLRCFGEYSTSQYYSHAVKYDWTIRRMRSIARVARAAADYAGIKLLGAIARDGLWGWNLVAYARPKDSAAVASGISQGGRKANVH